MKDSWAREPAKALLLFDSISAEGKDTMSTIYTREQGLPDFKPASKRPEVTVVGSDTLLNHVLNHRNIRRHVDTEVLAETVSLVNATCLLICPTKASMDVTGEQCRLEQEAAKFAASCMKPIVLFFPNFHCRLPPYMAMSEQLRECVQLTAAFWPESGHLIEHYPNAKHINLCERQDGQRDESTPLCMHDVLPINAARLGTALAALL